VPVTERIDKWLWAVRLFKTRSQATDACRSGKISIDGQPVKPSREIHPGVMIEVQTGPLIRVVEVKAMISNRVGAKLVENYLIDHTPEEEYQRVKMLHNVNYEFRDRGLGRPTKKERRLIEKLKRSKF
jgi:ribosome-associated heat shock protein Hsp15